MKVLRWQEANLESSKGFYRAAGWPLRPLGIHAPKYMKIDKFTKIYENQWKSMEIYRKPWKSIKNDESPWKSTEIDGKQW